MGKTFENLKGTYDYLPEKQIVREKIKGTLKPIFEKYGFAPIETPIICMYDLLASKYADGADILNEMYKLSDQGKRSLGLRYDLTITFSKLISSNPSITMPFKRYEIGRVYRDGPVKVGRNREFTQCDIDVVGVKSVMAEAEYMLMTSEAYDKLGLDVEVEFNNRKILTGILNIVLGDISEDKNRKCIMLIDKFAKMTREELLKEFANIDVSEEQFNELCSYFELGYDSLKEKLIGTDNELVKEGIAEIDEMLGYLEGTKALDKMIFAPYLARGIDIYTGMVWEVFMRGRKVQDQDFNLSIGGGGRYDKIITSFVDDGNEYPAVGMSFGLDVIYEVMTLLNQGKANNTVDIFVIPFGTEKESFKFATELRNLGIRVEIEKASKKLKKSMSYANKINVPYVVVMGEDEINNGKIQLKNMESGDNTEFGIDEYLRIKKFISK